MIQSLKYVPVCVHVCFWSNTTSKCSVKPCTSGKKKATTDKRYRTMCWSGLCLNSFSPKRQCGSLACSCLSALQWLHRKLVFHFWSQYMLKSDGCILQLEPLPPLFLNYFWWRAYAHQCFVWMFRYIYRLAKLHVAAHNYAEAAFTLQRHANILKVGCKRSTFLWIFISRVFLYFACWERHWWIGPLVPVCMSCCQCLLWQTVVLCCILSA